MDIHQLFYAQVTCVLVNKLAMSIILVNHLNNNYIMMMVFVSSAHLIILLLSISKTLKQHIPKIILVS